MLTLSLVLQHSVHPRDGGVLKVEVTLRVPPKSVVVLGVYVPFLQAGTSLHDFYGVLNPAINCQD